MAEMARLQFGRLTEAWKGEATDFTPLLAEQLDALGLAIGVDLVPTGQPEVLTDGGRRIDILAATDDESEFVIENQYGRGDHDHLTRGLAYAVARRARGLVVVAEEHRDEFRAVAEYLNDLAEHDGERRGIAVWLVEAKAVRVESSSSLVSPWAPLFTAVVSPNFFVNTVAAVPHERVDIDELWSRFDSSSRAPAQAIVADWNRRSFHVQVYPTYFVLYAPAPSKNGLRSVVAIYTDGRVRIPFSAFAGRNSGIEIAALTDPAFKARTSTGFDLVNGTNRTSPGWLTDDRIPLVLTLCDEVVGAYAEALDETGLTLA